jgi:hypothetical protein
MCLGSPIGRLGVDIFLEAQPGVYGVLVIFTELPSNMLLIRQLIKDFLGSNIFLTDDSLLF